MKKVSQSILFWCLLAAFVPCVISATLPPNSDGEKKLNVELQKRDICMHNRSLEDSPENRDAGPHVSQNSDQPSGRMKRGCNLITCSIHDLAYRITQISNRTNIAPPHKIGPCGYGRRRRRSLFQRFSAPAHREGHLNLSTLQV
ncbi:pro-adrenomedullin [Neoarius graeffei]|uniref:pro-adrenomedullin n=1 Tax=Neoarius graeffei TaxID=443677 RepID=UPI00298D142B|nr:pro-adrenomedullin [Neoarius graeffei]